MRILSRSPVPQISLAEARRQCRVVAEGSPPTSPEDEDLEFLVLAVQRFTEGYLGRSLVPTTIVAALDGFPLDDTIELDGGPVLAVESITYIDADGNPQPFDMVNWTLNHDGLLPRVVLASGSSWPATSSDLSSVEITYQVGNSIPGDSPQDNAMLEDVKLAMLMIVAYCYQHRGDDDYEGWMESGQVPIPPAARLFLSRHIVRRRFA